MTTNPATGAETTPTADAEPRVQRNDQDSRYEIWLGDVLGGFAEFAPDSRGRMEFLHTEVDPSLEGRGLGGLLVGEAMTDVAGRGETVVPRCPFVMRYLRGNDVPGLQVDWPEARGAAQ
ncbi:N-acetyltransferase [Microbacterium sp. zg.B48]|uniref:GNAT family N-acetyltransferase n=1 Tax=unclassified Microbacterium TaxID=2609290 RepID=UPI00214AAAE8|nr:MULTISPECIES: N-acetyltransferase [unclassified Microbacterium]MCR2764895.1 N-acetyltransferase [Microbacterium sp. zg.B48]MCR2808183.1 N-acetyltransferase [Microbacterium sp. zg.B185]WIM19352.1 N-acetyltransferase [Microbacterium sp. zg-B185]